MQRTKLKMSDFANFARVDKRTDGRSNPLSVATSASFANACVRAHIRLAHFSLFALVEPLALYASILLKY